MKNRVTIVVYHYVRDFRHTRFPEIKGIDVRDFAAQLRYLNRHYRFITMGELIGAIESREEIPGNSLLLTFDDGYSDHFRYVFPLLDELNVQGAFYPTVRSVEEHTLLDINKIHYLLASVGDKGRLLQEILRRLDGLRGEFVLESSEAYLARIDRKHRFDTEEVVVIKRLLQAVLPEAVRHRISDELFRAFVTSDEAAFAEELYLTPAQIRSMARHGMHFGVHGYDHFRLELMDEPAQEKDIRAGLAFLERNQIDTTGWTMCYPHGSHNAALLGLLERLGCRLALTIEPDIADLTRHHRFLLPRLDTNDLPKVENQAPNVWTLQVSRPCESTEE